jgi:hypothetical protein
MTASATHYVIEIGVAAIIETSSTWVLASIADDAIAVS